MDLVQGDYRSEMTDTVDLVVVGAYSAVFLIAYNPDNDTFALIV